MGSKSASRVKSPAYTRLEYIRSMVPSRIAKFVMGDVHAKFKYRVLLRTLKDVQVSDNALEAARVTSNKILYEKLRDNYRLRLLVYPHHVIRSNKMLAFAGADRIQKGMRLSFGTPVGIAARVRQGQAILMVEVNEDGVSVAKEALSGASHKLPAPCRIEVGSI